MFQWPGPAGAATDQHGDAVGHCPRLPDGQSGRGSARGRPAETRRHPTALQGAALRGGGRGDPDGAAIRGSRGGQARLRVSRSDGVPVGWMPRARWKEIDLEAAVWTVPPERMKHQREHRVPLSTRAREILAGARQIGRSSDLVFPSPAGGLLPDRDLSRLLRELGIAAVPHGFRSSFRDWAAE